MESPDAGGAGMPLVAVPEQIRRHGDTVSDVAERAEQAHAAARQVMLDHRAYGLMCAVMPLALRPLQREIAAAIRDASLSLRVTAQSLQTAAALTEDADAWASRRVDVASLEGL